VLPWLLHNRKPPVTHTAIILNNLRTSLTKMV